MGVKVIFSVRDKVFGMSGRAEWVFSVGSTPISCCALERDLHTAAVQCKTR